MSNKEIVQNKIKELEATILNLENEQNNDINMKDEIRMNIFYRKQKIEDKTRLMKNYLYSTWIFGEDVDDIHVHTIDDICMFIACDSYNPIIEISFHENVYNNFTSQYRDELEHLYCDEKRYPNFINRGYSYDEKYYFFKVLDEYKKDFYEYIKKTTNKVFVGNN